MENQGDVDPQTIAGAISTATHGTGGALSQPVVAGDAACGSSPRRARPSSCARATICWPGACRSARSGAISAVTLRCVPAFTIHRVDEPRPLDDVLAGFDELVDSNDHFELFVFPYTRTALTLTSQRTDREPRPPGGAAGVRARRAAGERGAGAGLPHWAAAAGRDPGDQPDRDRG